MSEKDNINLARLLERNLYEVFGQADAIRRAIIIAELYTEDCTFFEAEDKVVGHEALNDKVGQIQKGTPGLVFSAARPAQVAHNVARLQWRLGPAGQPPVVTGMDIAFFEKEKIQALYTFVDTPHGS